MVFYLVSIFFDMLWCHPIEKRVEVGLTQGVVTNIGVGIGEQKLNHRIFGSQRLRHQIETIRLFSVTRHMECRTQIQ